MTAGRKRLIITGVWIGSTTISGLLMGIQAHGALQHLALVGIYAGCCRFAIWCVERGDKK